MAVLAAPLAGALFARPDVVPVMRVLALAFVLNGLAVAPLAVISKELAFRAKATVAIAAALTEGTFGIVLALRGAGYWSLVGAQLAGAAMTGVAAWWLAPWKPLGRFAWARFREMARFGRHMVAGNLLGLLGSYLDNIVVGRWLGAEALGVYGTAFRWGRLPPQALGTIVNQVAFPSYVAVRDEPARLQAAYLRVLRTVTTLALPASLGLLVVAPVLVATLYPPRWAGMVTPLQIFAIFGLVNALVATTGDVFKAAGRPGWIPGLAIVHLPVARHLSVVPHRLRARRRGLGSPARDGRLGHGGARGRIPPARRLGARARRHPRTAGGRRAPHGGGRVCAPGRARGDAGRRGAPRSRRRRRPRLCGRAASPRARTLARARRHGARRDLAGGR